MANLNDVSTKDLCATLLGRFTNMEAMREDLEKELETAETKVTDLELGIHEAQVDLESRIEQLTQTKIALEEMI